MKRCLNLTLFLIIVLSTNLFGQSISIKVDHLNQDADIHIHFHNPETSESFSSHHSAEHVYNNGGIEINLPPGNYFYDIDYNTHAGCNGLKISDSDLEINSKFDCGDHINLHGDVTSLGDPFSISVDHLDQDADIHIHFHNPETSESFSSHHSAEHVYNNGGVEIDLPPGNYFYDIDYNTHAGCNGLKISDSDSEINSKFDCGDHINLHGDLTIGLLGCKDPLAANYNSEATLDDESCVICTPGSYGEDGVCVACPEGTFSSSSGASVCTYTSICADDEYETLAPTTTSNRVCSALSTCTAEEYESVAPTATSNRVCSTLSQCSSDEFEALAPSLTSDRECSALSLCSANEYVLVAATSTSDRICETIIEGCTDTTAYNFDYSANTDDGSCENLSLPEGWSMFGYTCIESQDVIASFEGHEGQIEIVKDESGLAYLPVYNFNAIGNLRYGEGYQIKLKEKLEGFKFCEPVGQADVDAAVNAVDITTDNQAAFDEGVASVTPEDGITQVDLDSVISSYEGYTPPLDLKIGDLHAGGIVFQINENGSGLVVSSGDLGSRNWRDALLLASSYSSEGYTGWHLPSFEELKLICSTVGPGANVNHAGLINNHYWSSTEYSNNEAAVVFPLNGPGSSYTTYNLNKVFSYRVRAIRSF